MMVVNVKNNLKSQKDPRKFIMPVDQLFCTNLGPHRYLHNGLSDLFSGQTLRDENAPAKWVDPSSFIKDLFYLFLLLLLFATEGLTIFCYSFTSRTLCSRQNQYLCLGRLPIPIRKKCPLKTDLLTFSLL